ncbi:unnamed protein product, partial [Didymodactylos carnosus]
MSSEIITDSLKKIKTNGKFITKEELTSLFDNIVKELNQQKTSNDNKFSIEDIKDIAVTLHDVGDYEKYSISDLLNHQLFVILRDILTSLIIKLQKDENFNENETVASRYIGAIFTWLVSSVNDTNVDIFKTLLLNKTMIESIAQCLDNIATSGKHLDDLNILVLKYIVQALSSFQQAQKQFQDDFTLSVILNSVIKCVCSIYYLDVFKGIVVELLKLNSKQEFLLITCIEYITIYDGERIEEITLTMSESMFNYYLKIFEQFIPLIDEWNNVVIKAITNAAVLLQYISADDLPKLNFISQHVQLLDYAITILNSTNFFIQIDVNNDIADLIEFTLLYIFMLTLNSILLEHIKEKNLISVFLKFIKANNESIQFHSYRLLATIMNEDGIKSLSNPAKITEIFINYIERNIDNVLRKLRLQNTLLSLKSLIQHNSIKSEFVKQNGLPLLIRCASESKFDAIKVQQRALEILLALTFNEQAAVILKNDQIFMKRLKSPFNEQGVKKAAEGIVWRLEKEAQLIIQNENQQTFNKKEAAPLAHKYDIMISYSHSDKDLCYQLQERLVADKFRVWLDRDN